MALWKNLPEHSTADFFHLVQRTRLLQSVNMDFYGALWHHAKEFYDAIHGIMADTIRSIKKLKDKG